jgi:hypothetical protein
MRTSRWRKHTGRGGAGISGGEFTPAAVRTEVVKRLQTVAGPSLALKKRPPPAFSWSLAKGSSVAC